MKYIDAEKLKTEIKGLQCEQGFEDGMEERGYQFAIKDILDIIDYLLQEQPEVDLEKEIDSYFKKWWMDLTDQGYILRTPDGTAGLISVKNIARHFYELGRFNARKEE